MPSLRDLPDEVLGLILSECLHVSEEASMAFKRNLPLLAVCQQLRRVALPLVYSCVFVQYYGKWRPPKTKRLAPLAMRIKSIEPAWATTNAPLLVSVGLSGAVQRAVVDVHYEGDPFPGLAKVVKAIEESAATWAAVVDLKAAANSDTCSSFSRGPKAADHADAIGSVTGALYRLIPSVQRLTFGVGTQDAVIAALYGRLAGAYSKQLQVLCCAQPIDQQPGQRFEQLRSLDYSCSNDRSHPLPCVDAAQLESLTLRNLPADHPWTSFGGEAAGDIKFGKLQALHLKYCRGNKVGWLAALFPSRKKALLHFPVLATIGIDCHGESCPFIQQAVLPASMERVEIRALPPVLCAAAKRGLQATRRLALNVYTERRTVSKILPAVNQLLDRACNSEHLELVINFGDYQTAINDEELPALPKSLETANLTRLGVGAPISVDTVIAILQKSPRLVRLDVKYLKVGNVLTDLAVPAPDSMVLLAPLNTRLRELSFRGVGSHNAREVMPAVVLYLLVRLPAIKVLTWPSAGRDEVFLLIDEHARAYPHLPDVLF